MESVAGNFYPLAQQREWLKKEVSEVLVGSISWFERDQNDVSNEKTPQLFSASAEEQVVPQQMRDMFSLKEIADMGEEEFDALIDEIDKNIERGTLDDALSESDIDSPAPGRN